MKWGWIAGGAAMIGAAILGARIASNRGASGGLDIAFSHLPPGWAATHGAVEFNPVTGTANLANLVVTRDGAVWLTADSVAATGLGSLVEGVPVRVGHVTLTGVAAPPFVRHIDRIEADGLNIANGRAVIDPAAYPGGKPAWTDLRPIADRLEAFGMTLHADAQKPRNEKPVDVTITHESLSGLIGRPLASPPTPEYLKQPGFVADAARAFGYREAKVEGLAVVVAGGPTVRIEAGATRNYDAGKLGSESLDHVTLSTDKPAGTASLARLELTGIDITRLLDRLPQMQADPKHAARKISGALRITGVTMRDLKFEFAHAPLFSIASLESHTEYAAQDFSTNTGTLRDMSLVTTGRDLPQAATQQLQNFGMADFSLDMDSETSIDGGTGHFIEKRTDMRFKGLGTLHITADLDGLKPDVLQGGALDAAEPPGSPAANMFAATRLIHAELKWDDASLVGRLFHLAAVRSGQSEATLRATLALPLASAVAFFPDQPDVADQINAFLDGRQSLTVTMAPPTPVSLAAVSAAPANEKAHLLGVTIRGN